MPGIDTFWKAILEGGTPFVTKHNKSFRRLIYFMKKNFRYAEVLWNSLHPDDPVGEEEVVHHLDQDPLGDRPDNLLKLSRGEHARLHRILESERRIKKKDKGG